MKLRKKVHVVALSPKGMAEKVEIIIIIVKDAEAVKEISFGKNGIIEGKNNKLIVADMSTIDPVESKKIAKEFERYQIKKLEIPVMGGPNVAITGKLVMMAQDQKIVSINVKKYLKKLQIKYYF